VNITEIRVSYGRTHNLGNYSNVRPEVQLVAALDAGEDPAEARAALMAQARAFVHEEIDLALEGSDQAAVFSDEPRYRVIRSTGRQKPGTWSSRPEDKIPPPENLIVIVPDDTRLPNDHGAHWTYTYHEGDRVPRGMRLRQARWFARAHLAEYEGYRLVEALDAAAVAALPAWLTAPPAKEPEPTAEPADVPAQEAAYTDDQEEL